MESLKKWIVCLDLTKMDEAVIGYINFFASIEKPDSVTFLHVIESYDIFQDLVEEIPEIETEEDLNELIRGNLNDLVNDILHSKSFDKEILIKKGSATDQIIKLMEKENPDLLVLGKKAGYKGEGVLAQRIVKYVPCSILFVPETARYNIKDVLVPIDFSEQSEKAVKKALEMVKPEKGQVVAQHLFDYPKQFFPYIPDKKTIKKMDTDLAEMKNKFLNKTKVPDEIDFEVELTLHQDGKMSDEIYDLCISNQTDLIVIYAKARVNMFSFLSDKLPDRMATYNFGIPLLILKNKEKNQNFFKNFLKN